MGAAGTGHGAIARLLQGAVGAGLTPGAVAAWGRRRTPRTVAVGRASVGGPAAAAHPDTWYDLASLTKPLVTTTLYLLALRAGEVGCETRVGEVLSEAAGSGLDQVPLTCLLTHTAGLPDWLPLYALCRRPAEAVAAIVAAGDGSATQGAPFSYSCLGFILLGRILERVAGERLDRLLSDRVLGPLGLDDEVGYLPLVHGRAVAGAAASPAAERRMTAELGLDPLRVPAPAAGAPDDGNARYLGGVAGNSGLFGSARGVYLLTREYLPGGGELLHPDEAALATGVRTADDRGVRGLGWQLAASRDCSAGPALAPAAFGHVGFTGTSVWADPGTGSVLVLLANRHHPGHRAVDLHPLRRRFNALALRQLA